MPPSKYHLDYYYGAPTELEVTSAQVSHVLIIGSCLTTGLFDPIRILTPGCEIDHVLVNRPGQLPAAPPKNVCEYQFQILQPPIRYLIDDRKHLQLSYLNKEGHQALFYETVDMLKLWLSETMRWNVEAGLLTFVPNFLLPQKNMMGRMMPRYDLRNTTYFIEQLNVELYGIVAGYQNAYVVDLDQITSNVGRRTTRDDSVWSITHGAFLSDGDSEFDQQRIDVPGSMKEYYGCFGGEISAGWWVETLAMYRVLRQVDVVKLVVVDLDDTLWRGIAAEGEHARGPLEGWPHGFIEALCFLKKRGVILAINSKNDETFIRTNWNTLTDSLIQLDDFAIKKINWTSKVENMAAIMREANLLPKSVVFIDDNPVERAAMNAAYPDMRILGTDLYYIRRILLWSAETQVPFVSDESGRRTELIQAQVQRDDFKKTISREEFLAGLDLKVNLQELTGLKDLRTQRAIELINKTNQFNSTGVRWSEIELSEAFDHGAAIYVFDVKDRFSNYGQVGAVIVKGATITQFVMSCRVAGLDVETAAIFRIAEDLRGKGDVPITALYVETSSNQVAKEMLIRSGFVLDEDGMWTLNEENAVRLPAHVSMLCD